MNNKLILASSSKQRLLLLNKMGIVCDKVVSPNINEDPFKKELPKEYSIRIAKEKALKVSSIYPDYFILSADTVTCCGRRILPKTETTEQAEYCLNLISGRRHRVYTTICLSVPNNKKILVKTVLTVVKFKRLSEIEKKFYILSNQWHQKSGGCSIDGLAGVFVSWIRGSHSSVMGLPLYETYCLLSQYFTVPNKNSVSEY